MKVRRYEARTYRDALAQVRDDLGPDAVILTTKELTRGGLFGLFTQGAVEIVAATDVPLATSGRRGSARRAPESVERPDRPQPPTPAPFVSSARAAVAVAPPVAQAAAGPAVEGRLERLEESLRELREAIEGRLPAQPPAPAAPVLPAPVRAWRERLRRNGVPEEIALAVLSELPEELLQGEPDAEAVAAEVAAAIGRQFQVAGPLLGSGRPTAGRVVALVGPTGVGKTTTLAKLAAQYGLVENRRVALLTVDTYRVAAVEQLRTFADIMALPIEVASSPAEARAKLWALGGQDLVLVDTAGRSQHAAERIEELNALMRSLEPDEIHLVVSATTRDEDLASIRREFGRLGPNRILVTKLDETRSHGALLSLAREARLPFSYLTNGQKVPEDMTVAGVAGLVELVVGQGEGSVAP